MAVPNLLTIAGSDPSGGAGIQADLKTFAAHGCYGTSVVAALTAQNTRGVTGVLPVPADFVRQQLETLLADVRIDAVKIGMLGNLELVAVVADALAGPLAGVPAVLDPVMVATSGDSLADDGMCDALRSLFPLVALVTPNLPEAAALTGTPEATGDDVMTAQAEHLVASGVAAALVKGGHLPGRGELRDVLLEHGRPAVWLAGERVETRNTHGTGCTLSSAIAAGLGHGLALAEACERARAWLVEALRTSDELQVGSGEGHGPVNHLAPVGWLPPAAS